MSLYKVSGMIVLACLAGCRLGSPKLSPTAVNHLKVEYRGKTSGNESIHLSGLVMNSMSGPKCTRIEKKGRDINIDVRMLLKSSPELSVDIPIDSNTDRVFWQGQLMWERTRTY